MLIKPRIYLDTSVFSAFYDERTPERQNQTIEFWSRLSQYEVSSGELAKVELERNPNPIRRSQLLDLLTGLHLYPITKEAEELVGHYLSQKIFTETMYDDALHVATATLTHSPRHFNIMELQTFSQSPTES